MAEILKIDLVRIQMDSEEFANLISILDNWDLFPYNLQEPAKKLKRDLLNG